MEPFNTILALLGALILLLALPSRRLSRSPFPPTLLALFAGILVGPAVLGWIDPSELASRPLLLEKIARLTLAIGLAALALRIPREFPRRHARELSTLVGLGMPIMWAVSSGLVYLILDFDIWMAVLIGAILTATDPIAASPIVTGDLAERHLPERLRHLISFESGSNDGLSYLFVFLPFLILTRPAGEALSHWFLETLLWEIGAATALGVALGLAAGKALKMADQREAIEGEWRLINTVALALLAAGLGRMIASDEVLVVFAAAATFVQVVSAEERNEEEHGQEAVNRFFSIPIFALLGTMIPWEGWVRLGLSGILLAAAVLLLRRPVAVFILRPLLPSLRTRDDALFVGWFGPIGVAAIYYAGLMEDRLQEPVIWEVVSLVICASVVAHASTGASLTRLYGKRSGNGF